MNEKQKRLIIESGKDYFRRIIIPKHIQKLKELTLRDFDINPFLINYLAAFLCGNTEPISLAKALIYPRVLGTSINTSFGQNIQNWITQINEIAGSGSAIAGMDIEFIDALDGRKKYCQCKAGPKTINFDDVNTILGHFKSLISTARVNKLPIRMDDMVVGILYGEGALTPFYKTINTTYPVYQGADFWEHLTGDRRFYLSLAKAFGQVVEEDRIDGSTLILTRIESLAKEIETKGGL
jgi:hypothetical protein